VRWEASAGGRWWSWWVEIGVMRSLPFILGLVIVVGGFSYFNTETAQFLPRAGQYDRYFPTPKASVEVATRLMKSGDWLALESYYELTAAERAAELDSARRPMAPFPLGAEFVSAQSLDNDEVEVVVALPGSSEATLTYRLKAHPEGYKFLPTS